MSYANDILSKCENAAVAMYVAAAGAGTLALIPSSNIFHGFGSDAIALPRIVCSCDSGDVEYMYDGNWSVILDIEVRADDSGNDRDAFHAICGEVFAHMMLAKDAMNTALSNADDPFTAFSVQPLRQSRSIEPGADGNAAEWSVKFSFRVQCCGSVIA